MFVGVLYVSCTSDLPLLHVSLRDIRVFPGGNAVRFRVRLRVRETLQVEKFVFFPHFAQSFYVVEMKMTWVS